MSTNTTNRRNSNSSDDMSYVLTNTPTPNRAGVNRPRPRRSSTSSNGRMSWIGVPTPPDTSTASPPNTSNNNHGRGRRSSTSNDGRRMSWQANPSPPNTSTANPHDTSPNNLSRDDMDWEPTETTTTTETTQNAAVSNNNNNNNSSSSSSSSSSNSSGSSRGIISGSSNSSNKTSSNNSHGAPSSITERSAEELQSLLHQQKIRWSDLSQCDRNRVREYVKQGSQQRIQAQLSSTTLTTETTTAAASTVSRSASSSNNQDNAQPRPKRKHSVLPVATAGLSSSSSSNGGTTSVSTAGSTSITATTVVPSLSDAASSTNTPTTTTTSTSRSTSASTATASRTTAAELQHQKPPATTTTEAATTAASTRTFTDIEICRGVDDQTDASNKPAESECRVLAATTDSCITRNDCVSAQHTPHSPKDSSKQMFEHGNSLLETVTTITATATATVDGETQIPATQAAASASASTITRTAAAASSSFNSGVGNADSPEETTGATYRIQYGKRRRVNETDKSSTGGDLVGSNNRTSDVDLDGLDFLPSTPLSDSDSDSEGRESSITASRLVFPPPAAQQQQQQQQQQDDDNDDDEMGERSASQYPAFESERRPSMKVTELVPSPSAMQQQEKSRSQASLSKSGPAIEVREPVRFPIVREKPEKQKLQHTQPSDDCPPTSKQDSASNPQAMKTNSEEHDGVDQVGVVSVDNNQANAKENKNDFPLGTDHDDDPVGVSHNDNNQVNGEEDDGFPLCPDNSKDPDDALFRDDNKANNEEEQDDDGFPLFADNNDDPLDVSTGENSQSNRTENTVTVLQDSNGLNRREMIDDTSCDVSQNGDENKSDDKENTMHFPPNLSSGNKSNQKKKKSRRKKRNRSHQTAKHNEQRKSGALFVTKTSLRSKGVSIPVSNTGTTCVADALVVCVSEYGRLDSNELSEVCLPNGSMMSGDELTTLLRHKLCSKGWAKVSEINNVLKEELGFTAVKMTGNAIFRNKAAVLNQPQGCFLVVCNLEDDEKNTTTHAIAYVANGEGRFLIDTTAYEQPLKLTPREIVKLSKYDIKKSGIVAKKAKKTARDTAGDVFLQRLHYKNEIACWYEIKPCSGEDLDTNKCQECNFDTAKTANSSGCPTSDAQCVGTSKIDPSVQKGRERNAGCPIVSDQSVDTLKADSLVLLGQDFCHRQTSVVTDVTNSVLYGDGDRSPTNSPPRSSKLNSDMSDDPRRD